MNRVLLLAVCLLVAGTFAEVQQLRTRQLLNPGVAPGWTGTLDSPACTDPFRRCSCFVDGPFVGKFDNAASRTSGGCTCAFQYANALGGNSVNATLVASVLCSVPDSR